MSKKLESILSQVPPATAKGRDIDVVNYKVKQNQRPEKIAEEKEVRITAVIPLSLKKEIRSYIENNPLETEKTVLLKCMKSFGFKIKEEWLIDKRRLR